MAQNQVLPGRTGLAGLCRAGLGLQTVANNGPEDSAAQKTDCTRSEQTCLENLHASGHSGDHRSFSGTTQTLQFPSGRSGGEFCLQGCSKGWGSIKPGGNAGTGEQAVCYGTSIFLSSWPSHYCPAILG